MKKIIFGTFVFIMLSVVMFSVGVSADSSGTCGTNATWTFEEATGKLVVSGTGDMNSAQWKTTYGSAVKEVVINEGITGIASFTFSNCENIQKIKIPSTLTSIGTYAFENCKSIEVVDIASLKSWCQISFYSLNPGYCNRNPITESKKDAKLYLNGELLTHVEVPEGITKISGYAFKGCKNIESVSLPSTVTQVDSDAFAECTGLTEVTLSKNLTEIGTYAFSNCTSLDKLWIPKTLRTIYANAFTGCQIDSVYVESLYSWLYSVTKYSYPLSDSDLYDNGELVTEYEFIGSGFYVKLSGCKSLKKATFKTTYVVEGCLSGCKNLEEVVFLRDITSIGNSTFSDCVKLKNITIPKTVTSIGSYAFNNCASLTKIELPSGVTTISSNLFSGCENLEEIIIPADATINKIYGSAFKNCKKLKEFTIPETVTIIYSSTFYGCESLQSIDIHAGITTIIENPFEKCSNLSSFNVDEANTSFTVDENGILFDITKTRLISVAAGKNMETYTIPAYVTSFEKGAFGEKIQKVFVDENNQNFENDEYGVVYNKSFTTLMFYPCASPLEKYNIQITTTTISSNAFPEVKALKKVYIPQSVTSIQSDSFVGMGDNITLYVIPDSYGETFAKRNNYNYEYYYTYGGECGEGLIWTLEDDVLTISGQGEMRSYSKEEPAPWTEHKENIRHIILENGVETIGSYAFYACSLLKEVAVSESIKNIGEYAFCNCSSLENIVIPGNVEVIGGYAFSDCTSLKTVELNEGLTTILAQAFKNCVGIEKVYIPSTVSKVNDPFDGCIKLKRVDISDIDAFSCISHLNVAPICYNEDTLLYNNGELVTDVVLSVGSAKAFENVCSLNSVEFAEGVTKNTYASNLCIKKIILPSTMESVAYSGISGCKNLEEIIVHPDNEKLVVVDGVLYSKNMDCLYVYPAQKKDEHYVIPNSVKYIYGLFKANKYIKEITVPGGVERITGVFSGCSNLEKLNLSEGVKEIYQNAFSDTGIKTLFLPASIELIGDGYYNNLLGISPVIQGYNDTYAQSYAEKYGLTFESVGEPAGTIDYGYFGDGLKWKLSQTYNLHISGNGAMPDYENPSDAPWYQYMGYVKSIIIADGVTKIGSNCFGDVLDLERIIISETVSLIGNNAIDKDSEVMIYCFANSTAKTFASQNALSFVEIKEFGKAGLNIDWVMTTGNKLIFLGHGKMNLWTKGSTPWYSYRNSIAEVEIPDGIENISAWTFANCTALKKVVVPDSVELIEDFAFNGCSGLEELTLPFIGRRRGGEGYQQAVFGSIFGFLGVGGSATMSEGVVQRYTEELDKGTFIGAFIPPSIKKVTITDEPFIAYGAFYNCRFNEIVLPKGITHISPYAFYNSAAKVTYPGTKKAWERVEIGAHNTININVTGNYLITDMPEISVIDVLGGKKVSITATKNATVYYTLDGSEPSAESKIYDGEIYILKEGEYVIKAIAAVSGYDESDSVSENVNVLKVTSPFASLESGIAENGTTVELFAELDGARILYTQDNTEPDEDSNIYSSPLVINGLTWIKAMAVKEGYANSDVSVYNYTDEYATADVNTKEATLVSKHSVQLNAEIKNVNELGFYEAEFVFYKKSEPENIMTVSLDGEASAFVENLDEDTEYCYFLKVTNGDKTSKGNVVEFKTKTYEIPMEIVLNHEGFRLQNGRNYQLHATVLPDTSLNKEIIWKSSNNKIATVDQNGVITAKANGIATITAVAADSGVSASCEVSVYNKYVTEEVDLSELNVVTNTQRYAEHGFTLPENIEGGNNYNALAYFIRWDGAVTEKKDKNLSSYASEEYGYKLEDYYLEVDADYHVQNAYVLPIRENSLDNDELKRAIKKYGAVASIMYAYADSDYGYGGTSYYYNAPWNWSTGNHLITLVGWDDNYSASNFRIKPEGDGAFIVKNSWGEDYGEDGFFYISYYDTVLAKYTNSYVYPELETKNNYNNIWQYDYTGPSYKLGYDNSIYAANVFPKDGRALANDELLRAVSFHTVAQNMSYEIYVIEDFKDGTSLNLSASPVKSGSLYEMGYHTVELDEYIKIDAGKRFAVVVRLISTDGKIANMLVEKNWSYSGNMEHFDNVGFYSANGVDWSEIGSDTNICIKAFTDFADVKKAETSVYKSNETIETESFAINIANADSSYSLKPYHFGGLYPDWVDTITNDFVSDIELPERYDLRDLSQVTPSKDQGGFGICWSFGAIASIESGVLKRISEGALNPNDNNMPNVLENASINYVDGKIYVNSNVDATLYVATYNSNGALSEINVYPIEAEKEQIVTIDVNSDCKAFVWSDELSPICDNYSN